jgi:hypothetical protein
LRRAQIVLSTLHVMLPAIQLNDELGLRLAKSTMKGPIIA